MDKFAKVSVFESDNPTEIQIIKARLMEAGISSDAENAYMTFTTTPTATSIKLKVSLEQESRAFKIIDAYMRETDSRDE